MGTSGPLMLGVEGGGSKTVAAVVDAGGRVLSFGRAGSSLSLYVGEERAAEAVRSAARAALDGVDRSAVAVVCSAMVGLGLSADPERSLLGLVPDVRFVTMDEGRAALLAATLSERGIVVLSGTGSFGHGVGEGGKVAHVGGAGPLIGDEGSAHWIATEGLRLALHSLDGRAAPTRLVGDMQEHYHLARPWGIIHKLHVERIGRHEIAGFARCVTQAAESGDGGAVDVLRRAAEHLAHMAATVDRLVRASGDGWVGDYPLGASGGVLLGSRLMRALLAEQVRGRLPQARPVEPAMPPLGATLLVGLQEAGIAVGPDVRDMLRRSLAEAASVPA